MATSFAAQIIQFNQQLHYPDSLPAGFSVINPFQENAVTLEVMEQFYQKFYQDKRKRRFIIGINPGRYGAGLTGIPFTDTKRLESCCGIKMDGVHSHEPSSVFVYDLINAYGGVKKFYSDFYINSPFPLAIVRKSPGGKWLNANYYDDPGLVGMVTPFMIESLKQQLAFGLHTDKVFVLGKKNAAYLQAINQKEKLFRDMIPLEHPRYI